MIGLELVEDFLQLIPYTHYIKGAMNISVLLIAPPESGKTELIKKMRILPYCLYLTDTTGWGLIKVYGAALAERKIRTLLLPDLITPFARKNSRDKLVAVFNGLTSEGIENIKHYGLMTPDNMKPLKCGMVGAITPKILNYSRTEFLNMGFISRMIPLRWTYSKGTIDKIRGSIKDSVNIFEFPYKLMRRIRVKPYVVEHNPDVYQLLGPVVEKYAKSWETAGIRFQKQLQTLVQAHALRDGRTSLKASDTDLFLNMEDYFLRSGGKTI